MSTTRDFGDFNKWEGTGNWKIIDCSWDRDNSSGKYKLAAEMGYVKTGEKSFFGEKTKLIMQSIVVKKKVGMFNIIKREETIPPNEEIIRHNISNVELQPNICDI